VDSMYRNGNPEFRPNYALALSSMRLIRGRYAEAERLRRQSNVVIRARGATIPLADTLLELMIPAWFRSPSPAIVKAIDDVLTAMPIRALPPPDRPYDIAARAYAFAGRPDKARAIVAERDRAITDTALLRLTRPRIERALGDIALAEKNGRAAIDYFRRADIAPDGYPTGDCQACQDFDLGRAFDVDEKPDSAIVHYERYLATPWQDKATQLDDLVLAGTHKRLGELYDAQGNRQKAIDHFTRFVSLWQNADAEFQPKVEEARKKLARLNASGR
jgi:tetratricopeptide (TPR) repeat protein